MLESAATFLLYALAAYVAVAAVVGILVLLVVGFIFAMVGREERAAKKRAALRLKNIVTGSGK